MQGDKDFPAVKIFISLNFLRARSKHPKGCINAQSSCYSHNDNDQAPNYKQIQNPEFRIQNSSDQNFPMFRIWKIVT
ncbi:hypothetical protein B5M47_03305 [candidate division CPR3 bacterium 4484_211]|uniref:Uncharacterized protein n=1 Tax=candidate division CPR3 bacterium 4484_211 TaxID=1968527 RepID=A0A1W9NXB5_UNCC3|nr:MAG: hypothetical protein B5M47_03305 [candidate division CPR3 bacterium 4484_211]